MQPFYTVYVVDEFQHLIGAVAVTQLLLAKRQMLISEMITPDMIAADVDLDQEEVVQIAKEYDLVVVPVIDKCLRLIGRITIDDLVDVIYEEHQKDIAQIIGTAEEEIGMSQGKRLKDLVEDLTHRHGEAFSKYVLDEQGDLLPAVVICLNDQQVSLGDNAPLTEGASVMFLTAISGG